MPHDPFLEPPKTLGPLCAKTSAEVTAALEAACAAPGAAVEDLIEETYALGLRRGSPEVAKAAEERARRVADMAVKGRLFGRLAGRDVEAGNVEGAEARSRFLEGAAEKVDRGAGVALLGAAAYAAGRAGDGRRAAAMLARAEALAAGAGGAGTGGAGTGGAGLARALADAATALKDRALAERAAKLGGEDAETLRAVARVAAASGDLALAAEAAERAPLDEAVAGAHAEVLAVLDQPAEALAAIERFLEAGRAPSDAVRRAHEAVCEAFARLGRALPEEATGAPIARARAAAALAERGDGAAARGLLGPLASLPRRTAVDAVAREELAELGAAALRAAAALPDAEDLGLLGRLAHEAHQVAVLVADPATAAVELCRGLGRAAAAEPRIATLVFAAREKAMHLRGNVFTDLYDPKRSLRDPARALEENLKPPADWLASWDAGLERVLAISLSEGPTWILRAATDLFLGRAAEALGAAERAKALDRRARSKGSGGYAQVDLVLERARRAR